MKRLFRFLSITTLVAMLASCGVFFAPMEGRWNIKDPSNELLTYKPIINGYLEGTVWHDGRDEELYAYPDSKAILLRFSTGDFPDSVAASYLTLAVSMQPGSDADLYVHRILQPWDGLSFTQPPDAMPGFFDDAFSVAKLSKSTAEILIPITSIYSGSKDNLTNGLIIYSEVPVKFYSAELGTAPLLSIEAE